MIEHQPQPVPIRLNIFDGIPPSLRRLFSATKKNEVRSIANSLSVSRRDLGRLKLNCGELGYSVEHQRLRFPAKDVVWTKRDEKEIAQYPRLHFHSPNLPMPRYMKKALEQIKRQRIRTHYLYAKDEGWHLFYYAGDDVDLSAGAFPWTKTHWKHGPHVHYASSLWCRMSADEVRIALRHRAIRFDSFHVRFSHGFP